MSKHLFSIVSRFVFASFSSSKDPLPNIPDQNVTSPLSFKDACSVGSDRNVTRLLPPDDPYSKDPNQNYLYDQACHHYASEHSARYESSVIRSKIFQVFYSECLTTVWPGCEVSNADNSGMIHRPYGTFTVDEVIAYDVNGKPVKRAHRQGFTAGELLEYKHYWYIFWHPSKPGTDIERFKKIKFAGHEDLYILHLKNLTRSIKRFQNAEIESPDKLYIKKNHSSEKHRHLIEFGKLRKAVEHSLMYIEMLELSCKLAKGDTCYLEHLLSEQLSTEPFSIGIFPKSRPGERIHLLYPLYTVVKPTFPVAIHYMPSGMQPALCGYFPKSNIFIAAAFDEEGNFVRDLRKDIASYLLISFQGVKLK